MIIKVRGFEILMDDEDFKKIEGKIFIKSKKNGKYAFIWLNGKNKYLHRFILNAKDGQIIDHINGNGLDNRKENLRFCTHSQNMMNQRKHCNTHSNLKGAFHKKGTKRWESQIKVNGKIIFLGSFYSAEKAHEIYCEAAKKYFGEFARFD